jgi:hypothetical protein
MQRHRVACHYIRAVEEPGDAAEALRLALGEIAVAATVEAGKLRVLLRPDAHARLQRELLGHTLDHQAGTVEPIRLRGKRPSVQADRQCFQILAVENQRLLAGSGAIARTRQRGGDDGLPVADIDIEVDRLDQAGRRSVVFKTNRSGRFVGHMAGFSSDPEPR